MSDEVLVKVEGVSKKFCRSLKKSLLYGVSDILHDLNPFGNQKSEVRSQKSESTSDLRPSTSESAALARDEDLRPGEFYAVHDVSFELKRGECLGLIGHNGAGKTTLLKMLNGLIKPDAGRIEMRGRVGALIALGAGFNPILTGRENIYVNGSVLGLTKKEIDEKIDDIIDFADIREFIDSPVQGYSSGMQVRLGFAVATALDPDVLLLDEVLAVGDANFRSKCYQRIGSILERCAVIFVSHDAYSVRRICNEVVWLRKGQVAFQGDTETGMQLYSEEASVTEGLESALIAGDYISNVSCEAEVKERRVRGQDSATDITVKISFNSTKEMQLGLAMANIVTAGEIVAGQCLLDECIKPIRRGKNEWTFYIHDLHLAKGEYSLVIGVFEGGSKRLAINIRHNVRFIVSGNQRYGPFYAPIAYPHLNT
jgi:lipopolysaccharide transport system ATP-binding protein